VAEQGCGGGFVSATASDDSGEVHVRSPWALHNRPTYVNLVVIDCQQIRVCRAEHDYYKSKRVNSARYTGKMQVPTSNR
jgi:hypothetical protein